MASILPDKTIISTGLKCLCPKCNKGALFKSRFSFDLNDQCPHCGLDLQKNDTADGPAVFMIFILGFSVVPLALIVDAWLSWPLWLHTIIWSIVILALTLGMLKPLKAYIIALQYKHRKSDWGE